MKEESLFSIEDARSKAVQERSVLMGLADILEKEALITPEERLRLLERIKEEGDRA